MAEHTYEDLHNKTVAQLREIAKETDHEAVRGYSTMHKEELIQALCTALGVEAHVHHEVVGLDKKKVKARIRKLRAERDAALEAKDGAELKRLRRQIHRLKHRLRAATI